MVGSKPLKTARKKDSMKQTITNMLEDFIFCLSKLMGIILSYLMTGKRGEIWTALEEMGGAVGRFREDVLREVGEWEEGWQKDLEELRGQSNKYYMETLRLKRELEEAVRPNYNVAPMNGCDFEVFHFNTPYGEITISAEIMKEVILLDKEKKLWMCKMILDNERKGVDVNGYSLAQISKIVKFIMAEPQNMEYQGLSHAFKQD